MNDAKLTGSFYTSRKIAEYMVEWAIREKTDSFLEPSFGDGVFLNAATERLKKLGNDKPNVLGVEIQPAVYQKYAAHTPDGFQGYCGDFMEYEPCTSIRAVVGNPPYVGLKKLEEKKRLKIIEQVEAHGLKMPSSASLWMPFVVHATEILEEDGRLAFVLPFEVTYVKYAYQLWYYLGHHFGSIDIIRVHEDFFPDVDVETVLLLADRKGSRTDNVNYGLYASVEQLCTQKKLDEYKISIEDIVRKKKPFSMAMLHAEQQQLLEQLRKQEQIVPLLGLCKFRIGYVCADKNYFHPDEATCMNYGLPEENLIPCIRNGKEINGGTGIGAVIENRKTERSLYAPQKITEADVKYIRYGEQIGVNRRYKCRQRTPWYLTPNIEIPDAILTVFGDAPKLIANEGHYAVSNSLLAGYVKRGVTAKQLVCAWYNSFTLLSIELNIHSLGGGVLVLIPGETDRLEIVKPLPEEKIDQIFEQIDTCIKQEGVKAAYQLGDKLVLSEFYHIPEKEIAQIREAVEALRYWRLPDERRTTKKG